MNFKLTNIQGHPLPIVLLHLKIIRVTLNIKNHKLIIGYYQFEQHILSVYQNIVPNVTSNQFFFFKNITITFKTQISRNFKIFYFLKPILLTNIFCGKKFFKKLLLYDISLNFVPL